VVADPDESDDGRDKPANGGQERKGNDGLELSALIVPSGEVDSIPVKDVTARSIYPLIAFC
jgi:hypothetical protein